MLPLLEADPGMPPDGRALVEVAVDAPAGPGPRTYTYAVPPELAPLEAGEAVLVPFGRGDRGARQAIGIVMGPGTAPERGEIRPVAARIRSDGPLLPPCPWRWPGGSRRTTSRPWWPSSGRCCPRASWRRWSWSRR